MATKELETIHILQRIYPISLAISTIPAFYGFALCIRIKFGEAFPEPVGLCHPVRPVIVFQRIISTFPVVSAVPIIEFAEVFLGSINEKIKECKDSIHEAHSPIYNKSLEVEIEALQWVQGQIQHLEKEKTPKYGFD